MTAPPCLATVRRERLSVGSDQIALCWAPRASYRLPGDGQRQPGCESRRIGETMTCDLVALCIDANDPRGLASFWAGVLGWGTPDGDRDGPTLLPSDDTGFRIRFLPNQETKSRLNRMHFDLTSTSLEDQQRTVERALGLGARHLDVGQRPEEEHVVLADPEGNEFCVIEPGNAYLAGCGLLGELTCDGTRDVGFFWADALGWPLVWDRDLQ